MNKKSQGVFRLWDTPFCILKSKIKNDLNLRRYTKMKGYTVSDGYMGYVDGEYLLFASEADYRDYVE